MKGLFFFGEDVGYEVAQWMLANYKDDIQLAVVSSTTDCCYELLHPIVDVVVFKDQIHLVKLLQERNYECDYGFAIWFGPIFASPLLEYPKKGIISMHPAYLPYTRGANFNIWPIVEESPLGVSLFMVNVIEKGIDTGDIVARKEIHGDWLDTGQTLREKAKKELIQLFKETYPDLRLEKIKPFPQDVSIGSTHYKKELESASQIFLEKSYTAKHLFNWLRARTYPGYPACYFYDGNDKYEIRVSITKVSQERA